MRELELLEALAPLAVEAELCRRSLREFMVAAWPIVEAGNPYVPNWHIEAIAEHLEAVSAREIRRLIINIPPRHMKSLAAAVFWPCWEWLSRPHTRFLYASYAQQLSNRDSLKCRRLIQSPGGRHHGSILERVGYQGLLALIFDEPWRLTGDQNAKQRFENTATGYRLATSVGGMATGEGGDILVIDDPHKADEVESDVVRESALDWHDGTMSTRLNDPKRGAEVVIMQRLHERDLTGHLLSYGGWEHLCLPAEYESSHPFVWPDDPRITEGELIWPQRVGAEELAAIKRQLGSYRAAGQLQQRPAPAEGGILKRAWWRYYHPQGDLPPLHQLVQSWDMAFKDTDGSDYVVGQVWGCDLADRYLLHQVRARLEFTETLHAVRALTAWVAEHYPQHRAHAILVEDKANGPAVISALRREIAGMIAVDPEGDKIARARSIAPQIEAGNVYLPGAPNHAHSDYDPSRTPHWTQALIDEAASFPNAAHDDQVDALSQALRRLTDTGPVRQHSSGKTHTGGLLDAPL